MNAAADKATTVKLTPAQTSALYKLATTGHEPNDNTGRAMVRMGLMRYGYNAERGRAIYSLTPAGRAKFDEVYPPERLAKIKAKAKAERDAAAAAQAERREELHRIAGRRNAAATRLAELLGDTELPPQVSVLSMLVGDKVDATPHADYSGIRGGTVSNVTSVQLLAFVEAVLAAQGVQA